MSAWEEAGGGATVGREADGDGRAAGLARRVLAGGPLESAARGPAAGRGVAVRAPFGLPVALGSGAPVCVG